MNSPETPRDTASDAVPTGDNGPDRHWLDASLSEVLGGRRPPDLSARILLAWRASQGLEGEPVAPPVAPKVETSSPPEPPPVVTPLVANGRGGKSAVRTAASSRQMASRQTAAPASPGMVAATLLIAGVGAGLLAYVVGRDPSGSPSSTVARAVPSASTSTTPRIAEREQAKRETASIGREKSNRDAVAQRDAAKRDAASRKSRPERQGGSTSIAANSDNKSTAKPTPANETGGDRPAPAVVSNEGSPSVDVRSPPRVESALDETRLVAWMNGELEKSWRDAGVTPADKATDEEWCRRVFLRLLGRIPTIEEVQAFAGDKRSDKREQLVSLIMASDSKYATEFAANWAEIWTNVLVGRRVENVANAASREQLVEFLKKELSTNKSLDALAYELISATGSNQPDAQDYNGAVNFLLAHADDKATEATARVSQVFLGRNLQCGQCHEGPDATDAIAQHQFWQLNAFFRQMRVERLENGAARLVNRDFVGDGKNANDASDAAVFYETGDGQVKAAYPVFLDGAEASHSGLVAEVDRRRELARRVAQSPEFQRTVVNRVWAHFLGFGIVNPVDELSPHNRPSHPELLERLAGQFAVHGYDMRDLVRWIVLSEGFSLSSKGGSGEIVDAPESGQPPLFSRYYARPMPAEQIYESLKLLAGARKNGNGQISPGGETKAREVVRRDFLGRVTKGANSGRSEELSIIETVPKSLIKADSELPQRVLSGEQGSLLEKVAGNSKLKPDEKIEQLFQASLARRPTPKELQAARELLKLSPNDPLIGLRDLWWALLNSNEFLFDH